MIKFLHFNVQLPADAPLKHRKMYQSRTCAVDPLPADEVRRLASLFFSSQNPVLTELNIGVTFCSLKDKYRKSSGRTEAIKRMAEIGFTITHMEVTPTHVFLHLHEYKGITMAIRLNKASGFVTVVGRLTIGDGE